MNILLNNVFFVLQKVTLNLKTQLKPLRHNQKTIILKILNY